MGFISKCPPNSLKCINYLLNLHDDSFSILKSFYISMRCLNVASEKILKQSIKGVDAFAKEVIRARKKILI